MKLKKTSLIFCGIFACLTSCSGSNYDGYVKDRNFNDGFIVRKRLNNPDDLYFSNPIKTSDNQNQPIWNITQWMSEYEINPDIANGYYYSHDGSRYSIAAGPNENQLAKKISFDTESGELYLECNCQYEYDDCTTKPISPYYGGEWWVHLLLEQAIHENDLLYIKDCKALNLKMEFTIEKDELYKEFWHNCAQFEWYLTIQNRNKNSEDYEKYMWFGVNLFDNREIGTISEEFTSAEYGSGVFVYRPGSDKCFKGETTIPGQGETRIVDYDFLDVVKEKFLLAQSQGYFTHSTIDDMTIGSTNLGFEVPGGRNIAVSIRDFNINYR